MSRIELGQELDFSGKQRMREAIRQDIINQIWDLWVTFTFFGVVSRAEAEKKVRKFFDNINRLAGMQIVARRVNLFVY